MRPSAFTRRTVAVDRYAQQQAAKLFTEEAPSKYRRKRRTPRKPPVAPTPAPTEPVAPAAVPAAG